MTPALDAAVNRLAKWRSVFAGWQLGTRLKGDPESDAVRDHREVTLFLRAEVNALVGLLVKNGIISLTEWEDQLEFECDELQLLLERKFPGMKATPDGIVYDLPRAAETMKGWRL